jgi:hypothetical protein
METKASASEKLPALSPHVAWPHARLTTHARARSHRSRQAHVDDERCGTLWAMASAALAPPISVGEPSLGCETRPLAADELSVFVGEPSLGCETRPLAADELCLLEGSG